jgi:hypothetical protein
MAKPSLTPFILARDFTKLDLTTMLVFQQGKHVTKPWKLAILLVPDDSRIRVCASFAKVDLVISSLVA